LQDGDHRVARSSQIYCNLMPQQIDDACRYEIFSGSFAKEQQFA